MKNKDEIKVRIIRESDIDPIEEYGFSVKRPSSKYVVDGIDSIQDWHLGDFIIISSMTGSGKTTFIETKVKDLCIKNSYNLLFISNRLLVLRQFKDRTAKSNNMTDFLNDYTPSGKDKIEEFGFIRIISYQKLLGYISNYNECQKLKKYHVVCFDECHYFINDSLFNSTTELVYKKCISIFANSIRIFMTATPKEFINIALKLEIQTPPTPYSNLLTFINPMVNYNRRYVFYDFKRDYNYVLTKYFNDKNEIIDIIKNNPTNDKWLIFVSNKADALMFKNSLGNISNYICADSKSSTGSGGNIYSEIVTTERFSCKVLISTSVADNGLNLKDKSLRHVVILSTDETQFLQMLGRKRINSGETLNLYICSRNKLFFEGKLRHTEKQLEAVYYLKTNSSHHFLNKYFYDKDIIRGLFYVNRKNIVCINNFCLRKLEYDLDFYKKMIQAFTTIGDNAFILKQLSWINQEKNYSDKAWINYKNENGKINEFVEFLNSYCNKKLQGNELISFQKKFKIYVNNTYGKQEGDRTDRVCYKTPKMRKILNKYSLNYKIEESKNIVIVYKI